MKPYKHFALVHLPYAIAIIMSQFLFDGPWLILYYQAIGLTFLLSLPITVYMLKKDLKIQSDRKQAEQARILKHLGR